MKHTKNNEPDIAHYNIFQIESFDEIQQIFPDGKPDSMNLLITGTSGVHGSYTQAKEYLTDDFIWVNKKQGYFKEDGKEETHNVSVTVMILHTRLVCMKYGDIYVNKKQVEFLAKLQEKSVEVINKTYGIVNKLLNK